MNRLNSIQALRFIAAALVVVAHCASGYFFIGIAGVDIFFVISGFIIAKVAADRAPGHFIRDRLIRIYPIYWLFLLPMIFIEWDGDGLRLLSSITLWPVFGEWRVPFLGVGWTLYFEMLFYMAATLVVWRKWLLTPICLVYIAALAFASTPALRFIGSPMVIEFALGVGIALLPATNHERTGAFAIVLAALAMLIAADPAFGIVENMFNGIAWHRPIIWGIPAALIVWGGLQLERRVTGLWMWLSRGGDASYSIYLSHPITLIAVDWNPYVKLASAPGLIMAGILAHYWIEKPLMKAMRHQKKPALIPAQSKTDWPERAR